MCDVPGVEEGEEVDLICTASQRPSTCLWRTPYGSIYTVGGGRSWEAGRLTASPLAGDTQCGLHIRGLTQQDQGAWQCQVGAVIGGEFTTTTAETNIKIIQTRGVCFTSSHTVKKSTALYQQMPCHDTVSRRMPKQNPKIT